ncbi:major facilitator superfamily domain-containing protein [Halteromyces radiatus]|uniref:major facilitator superfamily domain-containing protein n=1 Tax=Halteromyces radiatus TaxID=101107 RepID=UPI0022203BA2|nr:major facilitator superfamily domain-containing protein [Halteromyces radiatus]KAI8096149.1 major facilitator superfamily domain-containing protein [Halteromyces radiatus]
MNDIKQEAQVTEHENISVYGQKKSISDRLSLYFASIALLSDGYQALIVSSVESCLSRIYGSSVLDSTLTARVSNALLIGDIVGMLGFGLIIDRLGRKFGIVLCTFFVCLGIILATASSGTTPTGLIWMLIIARGITGVGVGGEYPCSSVTAGEAAEESGRSRGFWLIVSGNFVIDCGFVIAAIVPVILLAICGEGGLEVVWRLSIGLGLLLPINVLYFRLKMINSDAYQKEALTQNVPYLLILKHYWPKLLVTGGIWFLYDFVTYSFGIFSDTILALAVPANSLMQTFEWNIVLNVFYPFGALAGAFLIDRIGRKYLMAGGFLIQAVLGIIIGALAKQIVGIFPLFVILYGFFLFFGEIGPGDVTLTFSEQYPTAIRGTCFGLSAALGKAGAAIGTQVFKPILAALAEKTGDPIVAQGYVFIIGSGIALIGAALTILFVPDMSKQKMDTLDEEFRKILSDHGYNVNQLGMIQVEEHKEEIAQDNKLES